MLIVVLLAAAAAPQPGELQTFADWIVGCDNVRACQAVSLAPESGGDAATMSVRREPGAADPIISFDEPELRGGALLADGRRLALRLLDIGDRIIVHPGDAAAVVAAVGSARRLELVDASGAPLGSVSLAGAARAMAHIDAAQQATGGTALPEIRLAPRTGESPPEFGAERIRAVRDRVGCAVGEVGGPDEFSTAQIGPGTTLILLACGTGAYNLGIVPLIARADSAAIVPAPFDRVGVTDGGQPFLVNAEFDHHRRLIKTNSLGRGIGDCGVRSEYGWDGARFRLVRQEEMGECRFAYDYITTWRARVVRPGE